jgi:hypothetical protein
MSAGLDETTTSPDTMPKPAPWEAGCRGPGPLQEVLRGGLGLHDRAGLSQFRAVQPGRRVVVAGPLREVAAHDAGVPFRGVRFPGVSFHFIVSSSEAVDEVMGKAAAAGGGVKEAAASRWVDTPGTSATGRLPLEGRVRLVVPGRSVSDRSSPLKSLSRQL